MIAQLGMYDMPHARAATDMLWKVIQRNLGFGPDALTRDGDIWDIWQSPDLLLSQTCGLPFRARLHDKVQLVGTPDYGLPGCPPGYYNSVLVVRADDPATAHADLDGRVMTYNEALSQSGWAAPLAFFQAADQTFVTGPASGGHVFSAQAVADQNADFAALDALTWAMLSTENPDLVAQLRVVARTTPTPTLPYITSKAQDAALIAQAIRRAIEDLPTAHRRTLHLKGLIDIPRETYCALPVPPLP